jgi:hypothetical protein
MRSIRSLASLRLIASSMISAQRRLSCSLRSSRGICARYSLIALYSASASSARRAPAGHGGLGAAQGAEHGFEQVVDQIAQAQGFAAALASARLGV